jgi:hypothetical protein
MRRYIFLISVLIVFAIGCSEQTNIVEATQASNSSSEPNWISLPSIDPGPGMSVSSVPTFQASAYIDGATGGEIRIDEEYKGGPFGEVKVKAKIEFKKGAFSGIKYITMYLNSESGNATFLPHTTFNIDAIYNADIRGIDLNGITKQNVKFVYQAEDGTYEYIDNTNLDVDVNNGKLKVDNARLPHFSRYGFVN